MLRQGERNERKHTEIAFLIIADLMSMDRVHQLNTISTNLR